MLWWLAPIGLPERPTPPPLHSHLLETRSHFMADSYNLTGLSNRRAPLMQAAMDGKKAPAGFPISIWSSQTARYNRYWDWFTGEELDAVTASTVENKKPQLKYPLHINIINNFAWKHAAILMGDEATDTAYAFAKTNVTPKAPLSGEDMYSEEDKNLARTCRNIVNEVWAESNGRAIQMENAVLTQFLGGCVFQVVYHNKYSEQAKRRRIPVTIKNILPDFFVPIWNGEDFWDLSEAYVIYRIPAHVAYQEYPEHYKDQAVVSGAGQYVIYCEHWKRATYSIYLDGKPLKVATEAPLNPKFPDGEKIRVVTEYKEVANVFGFVPFVYIPHIRAGEFYGYSMVDDLEGITKELNGRMADVGDAVRDTVKRKRWAVDLDQNPKPINLGMGAWAINLGRTNPGTKATPTIKLEDAPPMSDSLTVYPEALWDFALRLGHLSNIAFGEDDVSQRSAIALAMRMFPTTAHSRAERTFWTDGLTVIAKMILRICAIKPDEIPAGVVIPLDFERHVMFAVDWLAQIPRDREQQVNEMILRNQSNLVSMSTALETFGDSDYISEEVERIRADMEYKASLEMKASKAEEKITSPVADDSMED